MGDADGLEAKLDPPALDALRECGEIHVLGS
jgi:hypothetical protein